MQWVLGAVSLEVNWLVCEGDYPQLVLKCRICGAVVPLPNTSLWDGAKLSTGTCYYFSMCLTCKEPSLHLSVGLGILTQFCGVLVPLGKDPPKNK